jgi:hypothetical protein
VIAHCELRETSDAGEDLVVGLDPLEGFGLTVVMAGDLPDCLFQRADATVRAALDLSLGEKRELAFDLIEPEAVGGREVQVVAWSLGEPGADCGRLVAEVVTTRTSSWAGTWRRFVSKNLRKSRERRRRWI